MSEKLCDAELVEIKERAKNDTRMEVNNEKDVGQVEDGNGSGGNPVVDEDVVEDNDNVEVDKEDGRNNAAINEEELLDMKNVIADEMSIVKHTPMIDREPLLKLRHTHKCKKIFEIANTAVHEICNETDPDLTGLNELMYAAGKVIQEKCGLSIKRKKNTTKTNRKPKWQVKIDKEIETFRREISLLEELQSDKEIRSKKAIKVLRKYKIEQKDQIPSIREELKQKLQVKAQRLHRFDKRNKFFRQNKIFETDAKKFYREIGKNTISVEEIPSEERVREFWESIWGNVKTHKEDAEWIRKLKDENEELHEQEWEDIQIEEVQEALRKSHKWKSPGVDKVPNFWRNAFPSLHSKLASNLNIITIDPDLTPSWLCQGTTYLLAKNSETSNPKNYRPITCLSTTYKLLTSILTERTYKHLDKQNIFPIEQKGCRKGSYGCKDQLLINKMILENAHSKRKTLSTAWIDYKKAFDSVPHSWILRTLELYKA